MPDEPKRGTLFVLSGPSGSGKSTVVARALEGGLRVRRAISVTTRPPRSGEIDGQHYHFWTRGRFDEAIRADQFLEWADVYGQRYGTLRSEVDPFLQQGVSVLLQIDVQGARQVRRLRPDCVLLFLRASSLAEYERRLRERGSESEATLRRRLAAAQEELDAAKEYDYEIINDDLDPAVRALREILQNPGGRPRAG